MPPRIGAMLNLSCVVITVIITSISEKVTPGMASPLGSYRVPLILIVVEPLGESTTVKEILVTLVKLVMGVVVIKPLTAAESGPVMLSTIVKPAGPEPGDMFLNSRFPLGLQLILSSKEPISSAEIDTETVPLPPGSTGLVAVNEAD